VTQEGGAGFRSPGRASMATSPELPDSNALRMGCARCGALGQAKAQFTLLFHLAVVEKCAHPRQLLQQ